MARKSSTEQYELELATGSRLEGRVERRVRAAVRAAKAEPAWLAAFDGLAVLALASARAVDVAEVKRDPYATAQAGKELREQLTALRMTPASRGAGDVDPEAEELRKMFEDEPA